MKTKSEKNEINETKQKTPTENHRRQIMRVVRKLEAFTFFGGVSSRGCIL